MLKKHLCNNFLTLFYVQCPWNIFLQVALTHRRRINTEEKEKVVAASWGTYLNAALTIKQQGWFEENFWEKNSFWEDAKGKVWCDVNQLFIKSIHFAT